jgi:hypothetical protein
MNNKPPSPILSVDPDNTPAQMIQLRGQGAVFVTKTSAIDNNTNPLLPLK